MPPGTLNNVLKQAGLKVRGCQVVMITG